MEREKDFLSLSNILERPEIAQSLEVLSGRLLKAEDLRKREEILKARIDGLECELETLQVKIGAMLLADENADKLVLRKAVIGETLVSLSKSIQQNDSDYAENHKDIIAIRHQLFKDISAILKPELSKRTAALKADLKEVFDSHVESWKDLMRDTSSTIDPEKTTVHPGWRFWKLELPRANLELLLR